MDALSNYITTIVVSLIAGYLSQFLQPKSRLFFWSPHNFFFNLKEENVALQTNSLTIQSAGRLPAENIEIIHKQKPDFFELFPSMEYQEAINPNGEHVIKIKSLGAKEWVVVQMLSYKNPPVLLTVRWERGKAKAVQIQPQRVWPKWFLAIINGILLIGIGTIMYWLIKGCFYIATQMGYLTL
jgi:hypothetical protein